MWLAYAAHYAVSRKSPIMLCHKLIDSGIIGSCPGPDLESNLPQVAFVLPQFYIIYSEFLVVRRHGQGRYLSSWMSFNDPSLA